jgi:RNA polymerase sigma factor (sigma-70 family)
MAIGHMTKVIHNLRKLALASDGAAMTDGQLLECFVSRREEAALEALVVRHGPMVWGVCRRLLSHHDAEDAFQATFLVLVRKAASIVPREMVGNWLYGVAHQAALNARTRIAKQRAREVQVTEMPEPAVIDQDVWCELRPILDQELSRLPDKYRVAIVLCDLEGKSRKEAARQLGLPDGTVASHLARGRVMLAKRLAGRGLSASAGMLAATLSQKAASAAVPAMVKSSTIKAVTLVAAGHAVTNLVSAKVAALTEGVLKTMFLTKLMTTLKVTIAILFVAGTVGLSWGISAGQQQTGKQNDAKLAEPLKKDKEAATRQDEKDREEAAIREAEAAILAATVKVTLAENNLEHFKRQLDAAKEKLKTLKKPAAKDEKQATESQPKDPPKQFTNSIGMKFAWIPAGSFIMGSPKDELSRGANETPHKVTLTKGFYMGVHLVTQEQWQEVMSNNPSQFNGEKNLPVDSVTWNECQEFMKKLRAKDKKLYRLPTEAEWEYSCRAGTKTPYHFGETISSDQANYDGEQIYGAGKKGVFREKTTPVGTFPANPWGLFDMHGNVLQWCQDWHDDYPQNDVVDPQGPEKGRDHVVVRGGSWDLHPMYCRSAYRGGTEPENRNSNYGIRVCFYLGTSQEDSPKNDEKK